MCSGGGKVPKAKSVEAAKPYQEVASEASESAARQQQLRKGIMSTFTRGYGDGGGDGGAGGAGGGENGTATKLSGGAA